MPSCPKYQPQPNSRVCAHYFTDPEGRAAGVKKDLTGSCCLDDEFMCVEWLASHQSKVVDGKVLVRRKPRPEH